MRDTNTQRIWILHFWAILSRSAYISLDDAMLTHKEVVSDQLIKMTLDLEHNNRTTNIVLSKRNWPTHIMIWQKFDKNGYGTVFPTILLCNSNTTDTKLVYTISTLLTRIKKYGCSQINVMWNSCNSMDGCCHIWVNNVLSILVVKQTRWIHLNLSKQYVI